MFNFLGKAKLNSKVGKVKFRSESEIFRKIRNYENYVFFLQNKSKTAPASDELLTGNRVNIFFLSRSHGYFNFYKDASDPGLSDKFSSTTISNNS